MNNCTIEKSKMTIQESKDMENALANAESFKAFMDYIAVCDHPEIFDNEEVLDNE